MLLTYRSGAMVRSAVVLLLVAATQARALPQQPPGQRTTVRARCADCASADSLRRARKQLLIKVDSLRWEVEHKRLTEGERQRVAEELSRTIRALEVTMEESMRQQRAMVESEVVVSGQSPRAVTIVESRPRMRGYLGVTFDGPWTESGSGEARAIRFYQYPRIALVEPSSPAERAGVTVGDTLLALNGSDVREEEISFTRLLVPNSRITMRVRRDGNPRELRVTVGETPEYFGRRLTAAPVPPSAAVAGAAPPPEPAEVARVGAYGGTRPRTPAPQPAQGFVYWFGNDALAGARLETITEGLGKALHVDEGVLVIRTAPGSLAYESGLREGDVVTHVGSARVRTVADLQRRIGATTGDEATLVIVRDRKRKEIRLRW